MDGVGRSPTSSDRSPHTGGSLIGQIEGSTRAGIRLIEPALSNVLPVIVSGTTAGARPLELPTRLSAPERNMREPSTLDNRVDTQIIPVKVVTCSVVTPAQDSPTGSKTPEAATKSTKTTIG